MNPTLHFVAAFVILMLCPASQRLRAPVIPSVDLLVPVAPVTFAQEGRLQLAYELHITNFLAADLSLTGVRVNADDGRVLAEFKDAELQRRLGRPGLRNDHATPHIVAAGMRAVMHFWIPLSSAMPPLASVTHTVAVEVMRPSGSVHMTVEGAVVRVSSQPVARLDPPLRSGPWVAIYDPLLKGGHRTAIYTVDGRARIPARFAIDFVAVPPSGSVVRNPAVRPADWNGYGADVLAVADGTIAAALDDTLDDAPAPVALENASGNYVSIDIGGGRFAFYEHLQHGSVAVKTGQRVRRGQIIARLGSSGSTSIGPHLHFHLGDSNSLLAAEGLPFVFKDFTHLGGFESIDALIREEKWIVAASDRQVAFERPGPNVVLRFR